MLALVSGSHDQMRLLRFRRSRFYNDTCAPPRAATSVLLGETCVNTLWAETK